MMTMSSDYFRTRISTAATTTTGCTRTGSSRTKTGSKITVSRTKTGRTMIGNRTKTGSTMTGSRTMTGSTTARAWWRRTYRRWLAHGRIGARTTTSWRRSQRTWTRFGRQTMRATLSTRRRLTQRLAAALRGLADRNTEQANQCSLRSRDTASSRDSSCPMNWS